MSPAAAAAARRERGRNAPLTDVYFCAQLGRDGSPLRRGCGIRVPPRPLVDHKAEGVSGARPLAGCPRSHPSSDVHMGVGGDGGAPAPSDREHPARSCHGEALKIALPTPTHHARTCCPLAPPSRAGSRLDEVNYWSTPSP